MGNIPVMFNNTYTIALEKKIAENGKKVNWITYLVFFFLLSFFF